MSKRNIVRNQTVSSKKVELARNLRKTMTPAENEFWEIVRNRKVSGLKFRRQQIIDGFVADFYCDSLGLCVEIDGAVHETEEQKNYDVLRDEVIARHNLRILRIDNDLVLQNKEKVIEFIQRMMPHPFL